MAGITLNQILFVINWITIGVFIYVFIFQTVIQKKDLFTSASYLVIGLLFPLILYYCRWSYVIKEEPCNGFFWTFICLFFLSTVFQISTKKSLRCEQKIEIKNNGVSFIEIVNLFWIAAILLNNKYCSGVFFPSLIGIDSHVDNAPILMYFVRSTYAIIALDILFYFKYYKPKYILYASAQVIVPVVSSSGRMVALEATVCAASLFLFLTVNGYGKKKVKRVREWIVVKKKFDLKIYHIVLLAVLGAALIYALVLVGIYRASQFGKYTISYAKGIGYTGPLGEVGAWLYGYFVISINNLNQTIMAHAEKPNYFGLYSFSSLFFGVFQFDNLFGISSGDAQRASVYSLKEATVPTGLWTFYYDYAVLVFIPISVAFLKELWLRQKIQFSSKSLIWVAVYFYYIPEWLFMGFTNTIFSVTGITTGVIIYVLLSLFLKNDNSKLLRQII